MGALPQSRMSILTLGVRDRAAMTAFYDDVVGFRNVSPKGMTMYDMGGFVLGLWERDKLAGDAGVENTGSVDDFRGVAMAYNARSREEVDEIFARLEAAGAHITKAPHESFWGGYSGYFADPEGNPWEVAHNPFWTLDEEGRVVLPSDGA